MRKTFLVFCQRNPHDCDAPLFHRDAVLAAAGFLCVFYFVNVINRVEPDAQVTDLLGSGPTQLVEGFVTTAG
jgi:hypothetical protein